MTCKSLWRAGWLGLCVVWTLAASGAHAATFTVTTLDDTNDGTCDSNCSLREAITAANAAAGADVITFAGLSGLIQLTGVLPTLSDSVTLQGPGADVLTVSGEGEAGGYRVFKISGNSSVVTLAGLTITNGAALPPVSVAGGEFGGGVLVDTGTLNLNQCHVTGNIAYQGGGVATYINTSAVLNISGCTFSNNVSTNVGGGLYSRSSNATIINCTFSGNTADVSGGALRNINGTMTVRHCTIVNNRADADGIDNGNGVGLGGGIADAGTVVNLGHTLLANNFRGTDNSYRDNITTQRSDQSPITSEGYNLCDDDGGGFLTGHGGNYLSATGDVINTAPLLGPLQDNGGPTPTCAPLSGSPAINAGNPNFAPPPGTDQRGGSYARIGDGRIDIGAYERQSPTISINDISVTEGNSGTLSATFTLALSAPGLQTITVRADTLDVTAKAGSDYNALATTITLTPGQSSKTVSVAVPGDVVDEADETFKLRLSGASNATINDAEGVCTVVDNDAPPILRAGNITIAEGNSSSTAVNIPLTLSAPSSLAVTVNFATADGSAKARVGTSGGDYAARSGSVRFAPGETSKTVTISVYGETTYELNEGFYVNLSGAVNASIGKAQAAVTITNDDAPPTVTISNAALSEGNSGSKRMTFQLQLSSASEVQCRVAWDTQDITAIAGSDYVAVVGGAVIFPLNTRTAQAYVTLRGDRTAEPDEQFKVKLSNAINCAIGTAEAIGTIVNDDAVAAAIAEEPSA